MKNRCVYEVPNMYVLRFSQEDVIATSGGSGDILQGGSSGTDSTTDNFADLIK